MNKKRWPVTASFAVVFTAILMYGVSASAQPGDAADPLVSKSYVDSQVEQLKTLITGLSGLSSGTTGSSSALSQTERDSVVAEALAHIETIYGDSLRQMQTSTSSNITSESPPDYNVFMVVRAYPGQRLMGLAGTEIILRGGSATAISGTNGLCDITGGEDLTSGAKIKLNHLLIVPASDGRGLAIQSDAYLMIKGGYYFE